FRQRRTDGKFHPRPVAIDTAGILARPPQTGYATGTFRRRFLPAAAGPNRVTYIVNDNCIKCKYMDCIEVCPVDCFYEGENMLVIHPDECIDCGVCEPECPVDAIKPDTEPGLEKWLQVNAEYAPKWPNITVKREPPADAKQFEGVPDKLEKYFSKEPGEGD